MLSEIRDWVYDPTSKERMNFIVENKTLSKALSLQVKRQYKNSGISSEIESHCKVKVSLLKTKNFCQKDFLSDNRRARRTQNTQLLSD